MKSEELRTYHEFNEFYRDTHGGVRSKHPEFHVFRLSELSDQVVEHHGPFQLGYYHLTLGAVLECEVSALGQTAVSSRQSLLAFLPGHIVEWQRTGRWDGYALAVRHTFLVDAAHPDVTARYQWLQSPQSLLLALTDAEYQLLASVFEMLLNEHQQLGPENVRVCRHLVQVLVAYIERVYAARADETLVGDTLPGLQQRMVAAQYRRLVCAEYLQHKDVAHYCQRLNVTAALLNKAVRQVYGKTAKELINEVLVLHATTALLQTNTSIKELAYQLNFDDYSHFVKFFKGATRQTPAAYRRQA